jgi:hypothetical protein
MPAASQTQASHFEGFQPEMKSKPVFMKQPAEANDKGSKQWDRLAEQI